MASRKNVVSTPAFDFVAPAQQRHAFIQVITKLEGVATLEFERVLYARQTDLDRLESALTDVALANDLLDALQKGAHATTQKVRARYADEAVMCLDEMEPGPERLTLRAVPWLTKASRALDQLDNANVCMACKGTGRNPARRHT